MEGVGVAELLISLLSGDNMFHKMKTQETMNNSSIFKLFYFIIGLLGFIYLVVMINTSFFFEKKEFVPYSARVKSFYIDNHKEGGVYYQRIKYTNNTSMIVNAFSAIVDGKKTRLIDYIAVGDSVVHSAWGVITVYREGAETYVFKHNPDDFKVGER